MGGWREVVVVRLVLYTKIQSAGGRGGGDNNKPVFHYSTDMIM